MLGVHESIEKKVRDRERSFFRKVRAGTHFKTGTGRRNFIVKVDANSVYLRTKKSKELIRVPRHKIRQAMSFVYERRITTRKELESFSNFSSLVMGLLRLIFADICRFAKSVKSGLLRLILKGTRFYFASTDKSPSDMQLISEYGGRYVLLSFANLRDDPHERWKYFVKKFDLKVLLDSGAFTIWQAEKEGKQVQPINLEEYARFIKKHKDVLLGWMSLDKVNDPVESQKNYEALCAMGLQPIPVWHIGSPLTILQQMIEEADHPVIALGGSVGVSEEKRDEVFETLFNDPRFKDQPYHWLGGSSSLIFRYPFFSADSSVWFRSRFGQVATAAGQRHVEGWSADEALVYTVQKLAALEHNYEGITQIDMLIPPKLNRLQLSLF